MNYPSITIKGETTYAYPIPLVRMRTGITAYKSHEYEIGKEAMRRQDAVLEAITQAKIEALVEGVKSI